MYKSLKKHLPQLTIDLNKLVHAWGYGTQELFMELREKEFISTKEMHFLCLKKILKANKIQLADNLAHAMVEDVWQDFIENNRIYPDTIPALNQLKQSGYKLGVITDCDLDVAEGIIKRHRLTDYFDVKVISSVIKSYKPNPIMFIEAIKLAKCAPKEGIYIGDSEIDIKGARETRLTTVILDRGGEKKQNQGRDIRPDFRINNLLELPKIISKLDESMRI
jgi:HAD superfamily hydrolase (TIGR01549 family)